MLSLNRCSCKTCRDRLDAYLHHELSDRARRRVAQHLGQCPACYAAYVAQRDLSEDVATSVRLYGHAQPAQLGRIWQSIQSDMNRPTPVSPRVDLRYGAAAFILMLALLLPWSLDSQHVARALPLPPQPILLSQTGTPVHSPIPTQIVSVHITAPAIPPAETPGAPLDAFTLP